MSNTSTTIWDGTLMETEGFYGVPVENGRVKDEGSMRLKSALSVIFGGLCRNARLTARQNTLLRDLAPPQDH